MSQPNRIRQVARLPGVRGKYIMLSRLLPGPCVCDAQIQIAVKLLHEKNTHSDAVGSVGIEVGIKPDGVELVKLYRAQV